MCLRVEGENKLIGIQVSHHSFELNFCCVCYTDELFYLKFVSCMVHGSRNGMVHGSRKTKMYNIYT